MPWQQQVLDVALEVDGAGRFVYRDVTLTVPRQQGKSLACLTLILFRALSEPKQNIRYTAQTGADARKKMLDDWVPELVHTPFADTYRPRLQSGHEALIFNNGSHVGLVATTQKAGHGGTLDLAVLDEAFAHPDARLEQALRPAMVTRPQPQFWVVSTAGTPAGSPYLLEKVERGRALANAGVDTAACYFEWSAGEDSDPGDEATWWSCMPALGHTVSVQSVRSDFRAMDVNEFQRSHLNKWTVAKLQPVISPDAWRALADRTSVPGEPLVFAFDTTPERSWSSVAAASHRPDGRIHLELIDHQPGTGWVVPRLKELADRHDPAAIYVENRGPAGALVDEAERAGLNVTGVTRSDHAEACGQLFDAVSQGTLVHLDDPNIVTALDGATKGAVGDAWAWSRRSSSVDISPLVAFTLAHFAARRNPERQTVGVWDLSQVLAEMQAREAPHPAMPPPRLPESARPVGAWLTGHRDTPSFMPPPFVPPTEGVPT
jgi:hypothetical protein